VVRDTIKIVEHRLFLVFQGQDVGTHIETLDWVFDELPILLCRVLFETLQLDNHDHWNFVELHFFFAVTNSLAIIAVPRATQILNLLLSIEAGVQCKT